MYSVQPRFLRLLLTLVVGLPFIGCKDSNRVIQETSEYTFDDIAKQVAEEGSEKITEK